MNISYQVVNGTQVAIITDLENAVLTTSEWQGFLEMICQRFEQMLPTVAIVSVDYDILRRIIATKSGDSYLAHKIVGRLWEMGIKKIDYLPAAAQPNFQGNVAEQTEKKPVSITPEKPKRVKDYCINGGRPNCKPVYQLDGDGNVIREFPSCKAAAEYYGLDKDGLSQCCRGVIKTCGGRLWIYKERYERLHKGA